MPLELDPAIIKEDSLLTLTNRRNIGAEIPISESYLVPAGATIRLREVPLQESPSTLLIAGYSEVAFPPLANQFSINYTNGVVTFHNTAVGATVAVTYKGRGSFIFAEDQNKVSSPLVPFYNKLDTIVPDLPAVQNFTFPADVTVNGNLNIVGVVNKTAVEVIDVTDDILKLNSGEAIAANVGIEIDRGGSNPQLIWKEADLSWNLKSTSGAELFKVLDGGNVFISSTLQLGNFTDAQEATLISGWGAADKGKQWFNTTSDQFKGWNGSMVVILG